VSYKNLCPLGVFNHRFISGEVRPALGSLSNTQAKDCTKLNTFAAGHAVVLCHALKLLIGALESSWQVKSRIFYDALGRADVRKMQHL
jgi:hypothetical protein